MKTKRFLMIKNFKSPYIARNGSAHAPHKIGGRMFVKGEQFNGKVINDGNGKPAFVMPNDQDGLVIPLDAVKEIVTKDVIVSNASGEASENKNPIIAAVKKDAVKFKYADAAILGALLGFGLYKYGVHKTWIPAENKNMLISIGITAALSSYVVYRFTSSSKKEEND